MAKRGPDAAGIERQKLARKRFRSLIRSVMNNRMWLVDEEEQKKISMNVKRNVAMLVRPRHKIGVLTMAEKGIIRTPHVLRTIEDRKALLKLVLSLKCFKNLSPQIRARLIPVFKFLVLQPGRKIMQEGGYADTIYFILYGEVEASRRVYNSYKASYVDKIEFIYSSGDCIGEIELIENCARRHTYTATSDVELLVVFGYDFDSILRETLTKQWYEKRTAIKTLGYFDHFNEDQMISANKLSTLQQFDALETIYHEDLGEASNAYFVLSGECMILQSLQLKVTKTRFYKTYELLDITQPKAEDSEDKTKRSIQEPESVRIKSIDVDDIVLPDDTYDSEVNRINQALQEAYSRIEVNHSDNVSSKTGSASKESELSIGDLETYISPEVEGFDGITMEDVYASSEEKYEDYDSLKKTTSLKDIDLEVKTDIAYENNQVAKEEVAQNVEVTEKLMATERKKPSLIELTSSSQSSSTHKGSLEKPMYKTVDNISIETRFIDVGTLTFGGIFGLGEKIEDRVIMARTKVQCLTLPRYFLFDRDQNPGRIWQRRRFVLDTGIPSRLQLYKDFLNTRKWQKYKNDFITNILDPNSIQNPTHSEDIPMMFHIVNPVEE